MPSDRDGESISPNGLNFYFKANKHGKEVSCCRLNKAKFITIHTPEYKKGMRPEEARAAWFAYLASFQPRIYPQR